MSKLDKIQESLRQTELVLEESSNSDTKEKLINGHVDVALVIGRVAAANYIEEEIASRSMCAVVPQGHRLYERESIKVADLKDEALICLNEKYQSYLNLIDSCEREGFYPNIKIKTMEAAMIYEFVAEGVGIGIDVDIHSKASISDRVRLIPIEDAIKWTVYVAYRKEAEGNKYLQSFLKELKR